MALLLPRKRRALWVLANKEIVVESKIRTNRPIPLPLLAPSSWMSRDKMASKTAAERAALASLRVERLTP